jgi:hypothetical protein
VREGEEEALAPDLGAGGPTAVTRTPDLEREGEEEAEGWGRGGWLRLRDGGRWGGRAGPVEASRVRGWGDIYIKCASNYDRLIARSMVPSGWGCNGPEGDFGLSTGLSDLI